MRGSSSATLTPCSGQPSFVLKIISSGFVGLPCSSFFCTETQIRLSLSCMASSTASARRLSVPDFTTIRSTTISIVCLNVFSNLISSSFNSRICPSTRTRVKPSFRIRSSIFSCSPFLWRTTGAMTVSRAPSPCSISWLTIWSTLWLEISRPQTGQWGTPILAYIRRR